MKKKKKKRKSEVNRLGERLAVRRLGMVRGLGDGADFTAVLSRTSGKGKFRCGRRNNYRPDEIYHFADDVG